MAYTGRDFEHFKIKNASVQYLNSDGSSEPGVRFGCMGDLTQENTMSESTKKCEGVTLGTAARITEARVTINAHVIIDVVREIFGISNAGLRPGVWSYGTNSIGRKFIFTADVINLRGVETKMIAYPNCSVTGGFAFTVDNSATEVGKMQVIFVASPDIENQIYYEGIRSDMPADVAARWHSAFSRELVEDAPIPSVTPLIRCGVAAAGQKRFIQNMFRGYRTIT